MSLSRDSILSASDAKVECVLVPEWGGSVFVKTFDGAARDRIEAHVMRDGKQANMQGLRALVVALAACDESGKELFTVADIPALEKKNAAALDRVFNAASVLNRLNDNAEVARDAFFQGQKDGSGSV